MGRDTGHREDGKAPDSRPPGLQVREVQVGAIAPYVKNAKTHPGRQIRQIADSIKAFGFLQPVVLDKDNVLIVGHGRLEAAKLLGLESVPAVYAEGLTPDQVAAYRLADNKLNESGWIRDLVIEELKALDAAGFNIELTGWGRDMILDPDNDGAPSAPKEPVAQSGDLWLMGRHRLLVGDATNPDDFKKLMGDDRAAMTWTDPPYNVDYGNHGNERWGHHDAILNDKMNTEDFYKFLLAALTNIMEVTDGAIYCCISEKENVTLRSAFEDAGGHWSVNIIWAKNTFTLGRSDWQNAYEPILYGWPRTVTNHYFAGYRDEGNVWENLETLKPEIKDGKTIIRVGEYPVEIEGETVKGRVCRKKDCVDIWREKKPTRSPEHPTMKPVKLVAKAIKASSKPGDIVLDCFAGGGSALMAAEELGRTAYLMELDPKYADVIVARWEAATGQKARKI